jgi:hypothetical protein
MSGDKTLSFNHQWIGLPVTGEQGQGMGATMYTGL